jgi:CHAD domain-containing protein
MRLSGKTLRYAMEVFEAAFDDEFRACLEDVKHLLDAMGKIHDCDVNVPKLQEHLREMRLFNRSRTKFDDRIPTSVIVKIIRKQHSLRRSSFEEMTVLLDRWNSENFKGKILQSMMTSHEEKTRI